MRVSSFNASPVKIEIEGSLRFWVAEAIRDEAQRMRSELTPRKAKTTVGRHKALVADELMSLANRIWA